MRRYWATLAGAAVGLLGGFYGALFGGAIGLLLDLVLNEYRGSRRTSAFLGGSELPEWLPITPVLCGALIARSVRGSFAGDPDPILDTALDARSIVVPRRVLERILQTAANESWNRSESLEEAFRRRLTPAERRRTIQAAWTAIRGTPDAAGARDQVAAFARAVVDDPHFADQTIVLERKLHAESCEILGIARDASREDIQRSYRRLAAQFHPDAVVGLAAEQQQASEDAFKRISTAYERLLAESDQR